ncbi:MAG TPA: helix-hairpin-helix domain-containing protein [Thermoanaerobaculia bacterium]|nr:helix-hairpin-helix domain-containing protein [Thermoanaerobaculia bacterium]
MHTQNRVVAAVLSLALLAAAVPALAADAPAGKVNVNQAGAEELALLPRIGPSTARRIVDFREENGPFRAVEDLMLVRGIGEKTFDLLSPYVALEGDTTLTEKVRVARPATAESEE